MMQNVNGLTQLVFLLSTPNPLSQIVSCYAAYRYIKLGRGIVLLRGKLIIDRISSAKKENDSEETKDFVRKYLKYIVLEDVLSIKTDAQDNQRQKAIDLIRSYDPDSCYAVRIFYYDDKAPDFSFSVVKEFPLFSSSQ